MTIRLTASQLILAAAATTGLMAAPLVSAPPASAACASNQVMDPVTGMCWDSSQLGTGVSGTGGICMPGRLGLCLGALQNSWRPGDALTPQAPAGPNRSAKTWP